MTRYIVSVGGSGQHIGLAVSRLVLMGALRPDIQLIAIDPDVASDLPKLLEAPGDMRGERHPLKLRNVFPPYDVTRVGEKDFESLFVDPLHPIEAELFAMMFDRECGRIPIHKGMYGTPTVGATVFAEGANGPGLQDLLKPLANAHEVFVCGSVVGGTGAGVMHKLIGEIRSYYHGALYGIFMLPWFQVATDTTGGISDATITRNASHGIKYFYEHTIPQLTASALIGYPGGLSTTVLRPILVDSGHMGENPHYLHLVAARALQVLPPAHTAHHKLKAYAFIHDADHEGWLLDDRWEHESRTLRQLVRGLRWYALALKYIGTKGSDVIKYYDAWFPGAAPWGDLNDSIAVNTPKSQTKSEFAKQVIGEFGVMLREAEFCMTWFERVFIGKSVLDPDSHELTTLLEAGAAERSVPVWPEICRYWQGSKLAASAANPNPPDKVARHHGAALRDRFVALAAGSHG